MFSLIGSIFKYSLLVLTVLVLSHVVQIQGVTISQHVLNGMHAVSGYSPKIEADRITAGISQSMQKHVDQVNQINTGAGEVSPADQQALNKVIENSQFKRK
jgi:hypothetical protein